MVGFIDTHRREYGVEPICAVVAIAPSVYYESVGATRPGRFLTPAEILSAERRGIDRSSHALVTN